MTRQSRNLSLLFILIATAALWSGVAGVGFSGDDYQYLQSLAPIQHIGDTFRPFVESDFNRSFFRPVANATMALDFLFFHWSGAAFHITNLLFHLIATLLVFFVARDIFRIGERSALWTAFIFGIAASHEYNLAVDTARADTLVAIFTMMSLMLLKKSGEKMAWGIIAAWIAYCFALLSKESAVLMLPFLIVAFWERSVAWKENSFRLLKIVLPFFALTVLFYFYHEHFTASLAESQPLTAAGAHSFPVLLRNGLYSIGYFFVPIDLSTATTLLTQYKLFLLPIGLTLLIAVGILLWVRRHSIRWPVVFPALLFSATMGIVLLLTFERWRLYLPSVGLAALIPIAVQQARTRIAKTAWIILAIPIGMFHLYRAVEAEADWRASTTLLGDIEQHLGSILSTVPTQPVDIGVLDAAAKLGSASVLQLGKNAVLQRAEADRISSYNRQTASITGVRAGCWCAIDVYAMNRDEGFHNVVISQTAAHSYLIRIRSCNIILYPASITSDVVARRDRAFASSDSIVTPEYTDIIRSVSHGLPTSIEVVVHDTAALLLSIDSSGEFQKMSDSY